MPCSITCALVPTDRPCHCGAATKPVKPLSRVDAKTRKSARPRAHKLKNEAQENEKRTVKYQSLAGIKKPHPRRYFAGSFGKYV